MVVSAISFVAFLAAVLLIARARRAAKAAGEPLAKSAYAWALVFMAFQVFVAVWAAIGLVQDDALSALIMNAVLVICTCASLKSKQLADRAVMWIGARTRGRTPHPLVCSIALIALAALFAAMGLEIPSNHDLLAMYPLCALLEWALIAGAMLGLYFLFQRRGAAPAVVAIVLLFVGIAEYFIVTFKSMPIQPGDLSALSTAAAVAGTGYTYSLSAFCLYAIACAAIALLLCRLAAAFRPERTACTRRTLIVNLLVGVLCLGAVGAHVTLIDYYNMLGITVYTWRPLNSYYHQGFLPTFISGAQSIKPSKPKGYTVDGAKELVSEYAADYDKSEGASKDRAAAERQFDEEKPTVIAIMNETFSDLSIYQNLHADYQGPQYFKSLSDTLARGKLFVSAYGGGTCNSEYEFLTGNTMAFLGSGVYPYTIYDLTQTENLASQFKQLGYRTTAMHPNHGTNWNRENVYQDFGFDEFLTIKDFQDAETLRGMVTDKSTYDKILQLLDEDADPQFIFDVTMQNHSGYNTGLVPADKRVDLAIDGVSDPEVNEYVSLIQESDKALQYFISKLRQLDRKVVVVFFGDHQPFFPDTYNDLWFTGEDEATHAERLWQTDYIIWANYDVAGRSQDGTVTDLSTNYLGSTLMDLIGAPMSDYQKAQVTLRRALPSINATGYEDRNLRWYLSTGTAENLEEGEAAQAAEDARDDYRTMQFYQMFGDGKDVYTKHAQLLPNETDPNLAPGA